MIDKISWAPISVDQSILSAYSIVRANSPSAILASTVVKGLSDEKKVRRDRRSLIQVSERLIVYRYSLSRGGISLLHPFWRKVTSSMVQSLTNQFEAVSATSSKNSLITTQTHAWSTTGGGGAVELGVSPSSSCPRPNRVSPKFPRLSRNERKFRPGEKQNSCRVTLVSDGAIEFHLSLSLSLSLVLRAPRGKNPIVGEFEFEAISCSRFPTLIDG